MPAKDISTEDKYVYDAGLGSMWMFGTTHDAYAYGEIMRLKDIELSIPKDPLTLEAIWRMRDEDKHHPKFHAVHYSEELRRLFEKRMGRIMTRDDVERILRAILSGEAELR